MPSLPAALDLEQRAGAASARPRGAQAASALLAAAMAVAGACGLLVPGLYRDPPIVVQAMRAQDLITLLTLPVMLAAWLRAGRGSARGEMLWLGVLGQTLYAASGAAFAYRYNQLFLVYVALFALALFVSVAAASAADAGRLRAAFDGAVPRRAAIAFLITFSALIGLPEVVQLAGSLTARTTPELIAEWGAGGNHVYALDVGVVAPLGLLSAAGLWRRRPWSYVTSVMVLVRASAMGLTLLCAGWFEARAGAAVQVPLVATYAVIAAGSLAMMAWFLRHCRG